MTFRYMEKGVHERRRSWAGGLKDIQRYGKRGTRDKRVKNDCYRRAWGGMIF